MLLNNYFMQFFKKISYLLISIFFIACNSKEDNPKYESPVNYNLAEMPYSHLSDYNFFEGDIANLKPVYGVLPYDLINSLFVNYAHKKRFIWMPDNVKASYVSDFEPLDFPTGTILIKNFYYENTLPNNTTKIVETRLMIKKANFWEFATYQWNTEQTDASYTMAGVDVPIDWIDENNQTRHVDFRIPPGADCLTCHQKDDQPLPIGPKPQNINHNYAYSNETKNQLEKWKNFGYLEDSYPENIQTVTKWDDETQNLRDRVRGYVDGNCAHCHVDDGYCNYRSMRFSFFENDSDENLGICIEHQEPIGIAPWLTHIVSPGRPERSVLYYRINTTDETVRMPLKGRTLIHQEAVDLIEQWINSLSQTCD